MFARTKKMRRRLLLSVLGLLACMALAWRTRKVYPPPPSTPAAHLDVKQAVILAKMPNENVDWLNRLTPEWQPYIYSAVSPPEPHLLPLRHLRGREAMAYLTFVIDHYNHLPEVMAFVHANRWQHHNDIPGHYTAEVLRAIRIDAVRAKGYVNPRCTTEPGCPTSMNPHSPTKIDIEKQDVRAFLVEIYRDLFDVTTAQVPVGIGSACCGQFLVTRETVRKRPLSDYERIRDWMISTNTTDSYGTGWVLEKLWHIVFQQDAIDCPPFEQCRCDLYGWCEEQPPPELERLIAGQHPYVGDFFGYVLSDHGWYW